MKRVEQRAYSRSLSTPVVSSHQCGGPCCHRNGVALGADVVTVLDRFLAAGVSREMFEAHLAARRVAVEGVRVTDPATPAPLSTTVGVMLDPE